MKNFKIYLIAMAFCLMNSIAFAASKDSVEMVSFTQKFPVDEATIALKNNTNQTIHNITFTLEYLNMKGVQQDYKTFNEEVEIAPGMTKSIEIPGYDTEHNAEYYKTITSYSDFPHFKVNYKLDAINSEEPAKKDSNHTSSAFGAHRDDDSFAGIIGIFIGLGIIGLMQAVVIYMAQKRGRNAAGWFLLTLIFTPIPIAVVLLLIGSKVRFDQYTPDRFQ